MFYFGALGKNCDNITCMGVEVDKIEHVWMTLKNYF